MDYLIRGSDFLAKYENFELTGRDEYLQRLLSILMRKHANSVILMGPGGVGCTAICVGVQAAKKDPNIAFDILRKRLFWLDTDGLFGLGDSEKIGHAFHRIIAQLERIGDSVLIVEDTKDLIDACRNSGTMHFINALLASIRDGQTQAILETKDEDLDAILKSHSDMRELFTILPIEEPGPDDLFKIVTTAAATLEKHHGIKISEDAIHAAIEYTSRHQTRDAGLNRAQPERSITLIDRALSSYRIEVHRNPPSIVPDEWMKLQAEMRQLNVDQRDAEHQIVEYEGQIDAIRTKEKELSTPTPDNARTSIFQHGNWQTPEVQELSSKIKILNTQVTKNRTRFGEIAELINAGLCLDRLMVSKEFSKISGVSLAKLDQDEITKLRALDVILDKRIFGQENVIGRVTNGIRVFRVGRRSKRPLPFLFIGPSGVGKTEVAKVVAEVMLDDASAITRFDMSEYMEKHAVAKMIGAPPGYEGFDEGGILTNLVRRNPHRVILFDEIEKAHPDVFYIFLQILEDGRLSDNRGRLARFDDTILIMTSNIGQPHFLNEEFSEAAAEAEALNDLSAAFKSEFLNRFNGRQNIICFKKLDLTSMEKIVRREINSLDAVYGEKGIRVLESNPTVVEEFCRDQYDPKIGARGLPGFITADLEPHIVNAILADPNLRGTASVGYDPVGKHFQVNING
jgi:ATP-dependent Clp protease ATP-binding subunit ClpB